MRPNNPNGRKELQDATYDAVQEATKRINDIDRRLATLEGESKNFATTTQVTQAKLSIWQTLITLGTGLLGSALGGIIVASVIFLTRQSSS